MSASVRRVSPAVYRIIGIACIITLLHTTYGMWLSPEPFLSPASYRDLAQWDSGWLLKIAERGYYSTIPPLAQDEEHSNVAFFPAPALAARLLHVLTGAPFDVALILAAQLASIGFWAYLLLVFRRWSVPLWLQTGSVFLIFSYPSAFYLVTGYAEPLMLFGMMGYLYWCGRQGRAAAVLAMLHGILMTASRPVGILFAGYPLLQEGLRPRTAREKKHLKKDLLRAGMITILACAGCAAFFVFCAVRFGAWDLYFQTQAIGWGTAINIGAIFSPGSYQSAILPYLPALLRADEFSRLAAYVSGVLFFIAALLELGTRGSAKSIGERLPLYLCAFALWFIPFASTLPIELRSMVRYTLPPFVLLVLAGAHLLTRHKPEPLTRAMITVLFWMICVQMLLYQNTLFWRFTHGYWVS